jgi:hypothetical protein
MSDDNYFTRSALDDGVPIPHEARTGIAAVEREARRIAAVKMGLVNDLHGERLPDDLWMQAAEAACEYLGVPYENWLVCQPVLSRLKEPT